MTVSAGLQLCSALLQGIFGTHTIGLVLSGVLGVALQLVSTAATLKGRVVNITLPRCKYAILALFFT